MRLDKSRICVSLAERSADSFHKALARLGEAGIVMAEIRLDAVGREGLDAGGIKAIFTQSGTAPLSLIATCRRGRPANDNGCNGFDAHERKEILISAMEAGADFVDIELDAPDCVREAIMERAHCLGVRVILSHHDFERTPSAAELREIKLRCFNEGAQIAKIACLAECGEDCERLISIIDRETIAIGMGEEGRRTRIFSPIYGSPFTFASLEAGLETAHGQLDFAGLLKAWRILGTG